VWQFLELKWYGHLSLELSKIKLIYFKGLNFGNSAWKGLTLRTEGIFRKLQKVMKLTQKWKDFGNNGTT
jgi:hypothetical protein